MGVENEELNEDKKHLILFIYRHYLKIYIKTVESVYACGMRIL